MCRVLRDDDDDENVNVPRSINDSFVVRVHRGDGFSIDSDVVNTRGILLEVYDPLRIDNVRVYKASANAIDRTSALKQQHCLLTSSWTHGLGIDDSMISHKIVGDHGAWTSICVPLCSAMISNAISGILTKGFDRIRAAAADAVSNTDFITNKTVASYNSSQSKWSIVMGGTSLSTFIFLGKLKHIDELAERSARRSPEGSRLEIDVDVSESAAYKQTVSHPEDRVIYDQYHIAFRYEVIHNSKVIVRSSKLIDTSLIVSGMKSGLKPVESDAERSLVDDSIDVVRGALVVSGIANMFMMKLEKVECIQATRNEHVCECCGSLQATKPMLCEHCMHQIVCGECASTEAFARHDPLACMTHKWKIEVPVPPKGRGFTRAGPKVVSCRCNQ
jgi:hypothetical protein